MSHVEAQSGRVRKVAPPNSSPQPSDDAWAGAARTFGKLQARAIENMAEANRRWVQRAQSEADLVLDLATKLASGRTFSESTSAYQEWIQRKFDLAAHDAEAVLAGSSKISEFGASLLSTGSVDGK